MGRHDRVMRLRIAEAASARYGWPLHVIEDAGHVSIEQPQAFREALRTALGDPDATPTMAPAGVSLEEAAMSRPPTGW